MNAVTKKYFIVEDEIADFERHIGKKVSERFTELLLNLEPIVNMAYEAGFRDGLRGALRMGKLIDLTGQRFERLTVVKKAQPTPRGIARWYCVCDCGQYTIVRSDDLRNGKVLSCGCLRKSGTHRTHGGTYTRLFRVWCSMRARCSNPNCNDFDRYGGRGIKVCAEWDSDFSAFEKWSKDNGYAPGLTIDRIDNDKGYSPDNCRWTTMEVQNNNKSCTNRKS